MPQHSGWVAAFVLTLLLAAVGAASEKTPLTAATLQARASLDGEADATGAESLVDARLHAEVGAKVELPPVQLAPKESPRPADARENETKPAPSSGNGTSSPSNASAGASEAPAESAAPPLSPPELAPRRQNLTGPAGMPIRFVVSLSNPDDVAQNVSLKVKAPRGWDVRISPDFAVLSPHETVEVRGSVVTPRLVGTHGTVVLTATGLAGIDVAYVDICSVGELADPCGRPNAPPANGTHRPPANQSEPANETPPAEPEPAAAPEPEPAAEQPPANETPPASTPPPNGTSPPTNSTGPSNSTGSSGASAEAWVSVEASSSREDEATREEEGPSRPVHLEL